MNDLEQQLQILRARMAEAAQACDERIALLKHSPAQRSLARPEAVTSLNDPYDAPVPCGLRESELRPLQLPGEEIETQLGKHLEKETLYASHRRHGSADIGALCDLPHDLLDKVSGGAIPQAPPEEWAFVDTETTGLAGGTGTCAFLIGVGSIGRDGFRVRQFFMRDYGEEASQLDALERHLKRFRVMITYNGKSFDQPLLETRFRMNRARPPFARMEHLDLLHGARRLWKLRFESCRLVDLENQILGFERAGDIPGALIPYVYFEYLRSRQAARLLAVFEHNALDILTLACLTGIVPHAFKDPENVQLRHGSEMAGLARWLQAAGELEGARTLLRRQSRHPYATSFCFALSGIWRSWSESWRTKPQRCRSGRISRQRAIRSGCKRWRNSQNITSTEPRIGRPRSNGPRQRANLMTRRNSKNARRGC